MSEFRLPDYELFDENTQAIIYNMQPVAIQRMLDFDYACRRETPSVAAVVSPTKSGSHKFFWKNKEIRIPVYKTLAEACLRHANADVLINFASFRSAYEPSLRALREKTIKTVVIIAEGIPERRTRELIEIAKRNGKWLIGPSTVGAIRPGCFKVGNTAGAYENIIESRLYVPGFVGFASKSGGMSNEIYNILSTSCGPKNDERKRFAALYEGVAIGGDSYPGTTICDHLLRFEANPNIKMLVALGEIGGTNEYEIVEAIKQGKITKPLVMWVTGTCSKLFPGEVQFGHAGAKADSDIETADAKNAALKEVGVIVPNSFDDFGEKIHQVYSELLAKGEVSEVEVPDPVVIPMEVKKAEKAGVIRRQTNFASTISDDRGEELTYNGVSISSVIDEGYGLGGTIGLLWFKRKLPEYASRFIELLLVIVADHGPAVSGAHNAIVAARAGKDLVSSVASGLLTIGPRFGGAIDDAARCIKDACDSGMDPQEFVDKMKDEGKNIPGIGHRVKSLSNPDKRVELIKGYTRKYFYQTKYLNYALAIEKITTEKKANLILNVDGCIGVVFLDMLYSTGVFNEQEIDEFVKLGYLNAIFVIGRSIGLVGHVMDQKRMNQPLYRHPWEDIEYIIEDEKDPEVVNQ